MLMTGMEGGSSDNLTDVVHPSNMEVRNLTCTHTYILHRVRQGGHLGDIESILFNEVSLNWR